jgi:hypothetical protein
VSYSNPAAYERFMGRWSARLAPSTTTLEMSMEFSSFDDYWQPFLGGSTPTSAFGAAVNTQTEGALARMLRDKLPGVQPDGSFAIPARAWAVKGTARRPGA